MPLNKMHHFAVHHTAGSDIPQHDPRLQPCPNEDANGALAQAMALRDAMQLVAYLGHTNSHMVQGALVTITDYLASKRLTPTHLIQAGVLPALARLLQPPAVSETASAFETDSVETDGAAETAALAAEALCALLPPDLETEKVGDGEGAGEGVQQLQPLVAPLLALLRSSCGGGSSASQPAAAPATAVACACACRGETSESRSGSSSSSSGGCGSETGVRRFPAARLPAAFFAASAAVRLARFPGPARELVRGGVVPLLAAALGAPHAMLSQVRVHTAQCFV